MRGLSFIAVVWLVACQSPGKSSVTPTASFDVAVQSSTVAMQSGGSAAGGGGELGFTVRTDTGRHYTLFYRGHTYDMTAGTPIGPMQHSLYVGTGGLRIGQRIFSRSTIGLGLSFGSAVLTPEVLDEAAGVDLVIEAKRQTLGQVDASYELRLFGTDTGLVKSLSCTVGVIGNFDTSGELALREEHPLYQYYVGFSLVMVPGQGIVDYRGMNDLRAAGFMLVFADIPSGLVYFAATSIESLVSNTKVDGV